MATADDLQASVGKLKGQRTESARGGQIQTLKFTPSRARLPVSESSGSSEAGGPPPFLVSSALRVRRDQPAATGGSGCSGGGPANHTPVPGWSLRPRPVPGLVLVVSAVCVWGGPDHAESSLVLMEVRMAGCGGGFAHLVWPYFVPGH